MVPPLSQWPLVARDTLPDSWQPLSMLRLLGFEQFPLAEEEFCSKIRVQGIGCNFDPCLSPGLTDQVLAFMHQGNLPGAFTHALCHAWVELGLEKPDLRPQGGLLGPLDSCLCQDTGGPGL